MDRPAGYRCSRAGWRSAPWTLVACLAVVAIAVACGGGPTLQSPPELPAGFEPTVELPGEPGSLKLAVIGDSGTGDREQWQVARAMAAYHEVFPFDTVLMLGDNMYGGEDPDDYDENFAHPYRELLDAGVEFRASLGNHDELAQRFYVHFNMGGEAYYSFSPDGHEIRFFALYTDYLDSRQRRWLEEELASSDEPWKIAFFHHPIYSSAGRHGSDEDLREALEPLFLEHGVDVVLAGHDHVYERIRPQRGIHYFVAGSSGKLRRGDIEQSPLTARGFDRDQVFVLLEFIDGTMHFQAVSRRGAVVDRGALSERPDDGASVAATGDDGSSTEER